MATTMKTPGVYIVEKDAFGNSVVPVPTAVPAFIGYTQKAMMGSKSLTNVPTKITSLGDFEQYFGLGPQALAASGDPVIQFDLTIPSLSSDSGSDPMTSGVQPDGSLVFGLMGEDAKLAYDTGQYYLYNSIRWFYQNGGGDAYILSIGDYQETPAQGDMNSAIALLEKEAEPTMLVIPDLMVLTQGAGITSVQETMLSHCGEMQSRFAILDLFQGYVERDEAENSVVENFRSINSNYMQWGAVYYPWVYSTVVTPSEISYLLLNPSGRSNLQEVLDNEIDALPSSQTSDDQKIEYKEVVSLMAGETLESGSSVDPTMDATTIDQTLRQISNSYNDLMVEIQRLCNLIPPSGAMAGVYTATDNAVGVWKAPANTGLSGSSDVTVQVTNKSQEDLNVPLNGKAVNAIRSFVGDGIKIWGARTLLGNSNDWRYINVRRNMIFLEQSIKSAARAFVFDPNDANTWTTIKSMIDNFLTQQWKAGAVVGPTAAQAFSVTVGLGSTMTADDINNGIMRITVLVAPSKPAEFIEITFQQQQQQA